MIDVNINIPFSCGYMDQIDARVWTNQINISSIRIWRLIYIALQCHQNNHSLANLLGNQKNFSIDLVHHYTAPFQTSNYLFKLEWVQCLMNIWILSFLTLQDRFWKPLKS
eukprot:NODE_376_length_8513_cov_1.020086.p10 type:complete len:110 gc:universal NODE_376_length_8513_cov_1.020086:4552-4881(+)